MSLTAEVYKLMVGMPAEEKYALTSQIKRCAISIPSNIAEGAGRNSNSDFAHFLDISNGSTNELETQLLLAERLGYLRKEALEPALNMIDHIQKMNYKLVKTLRK